MPEDPDIRSTPTDARQRKAPLARVAGELVEMSRWKKKMLSFFLLLAAIGGVLWVPARISQREVAKTAETVPMASDQSPDATAPAGARGLVDGSRPTGTPGSAEPTAIEYAPLPWTARAGGWLAKLGLSFAGGLVLGVFFRAFLKTMAAITALVITGIVALSYFEVINVDFSTMRQNYDSYAGWIRGQAYKFKDMIVAVLPSFVAASGGFFAGFIRR